jgi:hypothetical protein
VLQTFLSFFEVTLESFLVSSERLKFELPVLLLFLAKLFADFHILSEFVDLKLEFEGLLSLLVSRLEKI